jgi:hypothetical protein
VEVRVKGGYEGNAYGNYLEIRGSLNMVGTRTAPIVFRDDSTINTMTWRGIIIKGAQGGLLNADYFDISNALESIAYDQVPNVGVTYNYCTFRYCNYGISPNRAAFFKHCSFIGNNLGVSNYLATQALYLENCTFLGNDLAVSVVTAPLSVDSCSFTNNNRCVFGNGGVGFPLPGSNAPVSIKNSSFTGSMGVAISDISTCTIQNCTITNNGGGVQNLSYGSLRNCTITNNTGDAVTAGANAIVESNIINNNQNGVAIVNTNIADVQPAIQFNKICGNTAYDILNNTDLNLEVGENCFCLQDSATLEAKIYDGYDDITRGLLNYTVYQADCQTVVQRVIKVNLTAIDNKFENTTINVFPNPVNAVLNLTADANLLGNTVRITNMQGSVIADFTLTNTQTSLDTNDWAKGAYILQVLNGTNAPTHYKIIKM